MSSTVNEFPEDSAEHGNGTETTSPPPNASTPLGNPVTPAPELHVGYLKGVIKHLSTYLQELVRITGSHQGLPQEDREDLASRLSDGPSSHLATASKLIERSAPSQVDFDEVRLHVKDAVNTIAVHCARMDALEQLSVPWFDPGLSRLRRYEVLLPCLQRLRKLNTTAPMTDLKITGRELFESDAFPLNRARPTYLLVRVYRFSSKGSDVPAGARCGICLRPCDKAGHTGPACTSMLTLCCLEPIHGCCVGMVIKGEFDSTRSPYCPACRVPCRDGFIIAERIWHLQNAIRKYIESG
jgi:hypothetical protein